ncbi:MAG TPA: sigma 54-interacting transcriptional regulator [Candidatus Acidoferrales bacterium]|jgi:transcriptional regulator with GAF, ATPase, and Fis domain|nr:sigma 54-interacting transcriptional regulator [Candidatus Acidoferrales bacterium]
MEEVGDNRYDSRFDPNLAADLLLEISREHSLDKLLRILGDRILERPHVGRVYFFFARPGDLCATCVWRSKCPDKTRCLHARLGLRKAINDGKESPVELERYKRIPIGMGILGKVAATQQPVVFSDLDRNPGELADVKWLQQEQIRGFQAVPIVHKNEVLGVFAVFTRLNAPEESRIWARILANHIAAAVANARAFEEIQKLKVELEQHNAYLKEEVIEAKAFGDLVGQSAALRQIVSQIDLVAPTDASVLIFGETGTGKELVAHEIHHRSRRKDKPFIRVNCASIPKDLYESEFFGHAKGAFTGAVKDRAGRFEAAEGGTLFLDEIGEVPLELQSKLLRVLQEKSYERVGEDRTRRTDVRIIAATNRDLKREVASGRFREDLYYRLNVFPVHVAPLRERREDVSFLAHHFVNFSVKAMGCAKPRLTRAGIIQLQNYDWPGNIRELRNIIERAVILARGRILEFDLPANQTQSTAGAIEPGNRAATIREQSTRQDEPTPEHPEKVDFLTDAEMQQFERNNLIVALDKVNWKIKGRDGAAELLGVKPATLVSRIKKLGLKREK